MKDKHVDEMRTFSRFYTNILGLLNTHILDSRFSLAEVRILYELYHHKDYTSKDLIESLQMDKGQLSRMLVKFENQNLVARIRSKTDKRSFLLSLTKKGLKEFEILNKASNDQVMQLLMQLDEKNMSELVHHMKEIRKILSVINNDVL